MYYEQSVRLGVLRKYLVSQVFSGLADQYHWQHICFPSPLLQSSLLFQSSPPSCLLLLPALYFVLKGFSTVRYPSFVLSKFNCALAKEIQIFSGLGIYCGIFAIYLQCPSKDSRSRSANLIFYVLCLLYFLCFSTFVLDLTSFVLEVSDNSICKSIIFYQFCRRVSIHYRFNFKLTQRQC